MFSVADQDYDGFGFEIVCRSTNCDSSTFASGDFQIYLYKDLRGKKLSADDTITMRDAVYFTTLNDTWTQTSTTVPYSYKVNAEIDSSYSFNTVPTSALCYAYLSATIDGCTNTAVLDIGNNPNWMLLTLPSSESSSSSSSGGDEDTSFSFSSFRSLTFAVYAI